MSISRQVLASLLILAALFAILQPQLAVAQVVDDSENTNLNLRKIIVCADDTSDSERDSALAQFKTKAFKRLNHVGRIDVANLTDEQANELKAKNKKIVRIDNDAIATAVGEVESLSRFNRVTNQARVVSQAQTLPWGVEKINADDTWSSVSGAGIKVGIIDTGINVGHPDLVGQVKGGYNTINPRRSYTDDNGHGSHVAGIVAATSNSFGVVGVAPKAQLYSIKVLDRHGSGYVSDIIEGIDYAIGQRLHVINMSLGLTQDIPSLRDAVIRAKNAGIVQVAAAGNSGGSVIYPAAYAEVIAVGATDSLDRIANFSSRGPAVDIAAPGVSIVSTHLYTNYATYSGTSMATPHVAGVAALLLSAPGKCQYLLDSIAGCSTTEVQTRLENTARQSSYDTTSGKDSIFGSGIVDAYQAVIAQ